jgi:hypothetical protein
MHPVALRDPMEHSAKSKRQIISNLTSCRTCLTWKSASDEPVPDWRQDDRWSTQYFSPVAAHSSQPSLLHLAPEDITATVTARNDTTGSSRRCLEPS